VLKSDAKIILIPVVSIRVYDLYCSHSVVRVITWRGMRWAGHVARMGEERGVYRVLVGKPEGKRPLGSGHVARMGEERGVYRVLVGKNH